MIDFSRLSEALTTLSEQWTGGGPPTNTDEHYVFAAVRLLLAGQDISWCETHDAQQDREDRSGFACDWADGRAECHITPARLILLKGDG